VAPSNDRPDGFGSPDWYSGGSEMSGEPGGFPGTERSGGGRRARRERPSEPDPFPDQGSSWDDGGYPAGDETRVGYPTASGNRPDDGYGRPSEGGYGQDYGAGDGQGNRGYDPARDGGYDRGYPSHADDGYGQGYGVPPDDGYGAPDYTRAEQGYGQDPDAYGRGGYPPDSTDALFLGRGRTNQGDVVTSNETEVDSLGKRRFIDFPRFGRSGWKRWIPSWKLITGLFLTGIGTGMAAFLVMYMITDIPSANKTETEYESTIVYYSDGKTEIGRFSLQNRTKVNLDQIPDHVQKAVLSAEDRTFYTNSGISPTSIARAAWSIASGGSMQGGSTITQQYVKNFFLTPEQTVTRKTNEMFIALKLRRKYTPDQILEGYLNTIYLGRSSYGIQAAARAYFNTDVSKLTISQGAFIAGIINGPELYDPYDGKASGDRAHVRWNFVVKGMVSEGWLTPEKAATLQFPKVLKPSQGNDMQGQKGYLLALVRRQARARLNVDDKQLDTGGFKIVTTFDAQAVKDAETAVKEILPDYDKWPSGTQLALSSVDPKTGAVRAIYGGQDYLKRNQNAATQDIAQAGSTFKPFTLIAALEGKNGGTPVSLRSRFDGRSPQNYVGLEKPVKNFGGRSFGTIDLIKATQSSVNTVYVALNEKIGPANTEDVALRAGIPKNTRGLSGQLLNVLGTASPHPVDLASAYSTIANRGVRNDTHYLEKVTGSNGGVIWEHEDKSEKVFEEDVIADTTYAMQQVVEKGSGTRAKKLGRPAAGKTGTSSSTLSAWFVGFTPELSTSVAMYRLNSEGNPIEVNGFGQFEGQDMTGGAYPAMVWTDFMSRQLEGKPIENFPEPVFLGEVVNPEPTQTQTPSESASPTNTIPSIPDPQDIPSFTPSFPSRPDHRPTTSQPVPSETEPPDEPEDPLPTTPDPGQPTGQPGGPGFDDGRG
jgi:membrane peptidoglycan carboxypeptidase